MIETTGSLAHRRASAPSSWRLVNLALGIAALVNFVGASGFPALIPSHWLMELWFTHGALRTVSPWTQAAARIGTDLWLPASVLIVIFYFAGLHRRLGAPTSKSASAGLTLVWAGNIALTLIFAAVGGSDWAGAFIFFIGFFLVPAPLVLIGVGLAAGVAEFSALVRFTDLKTACRPFALFSWAALPPVLSVVPLLSAPSNPIALSAKENSDYAIMCKDVGVRLMERPLAPVRSIAYDWNHDHLSASPSEGRIHTDSNGRILGSGGYPERISADAQKSQLLEFEIDFTEKPRGDGAGRATVNPDAPYYHFPPSRTLQPYYGVESITADVLVFLEVDNADELRKKAPIHQGAISHKLTVTDLRSREVLGVQTYVVDRLNNRACGANVDDTTISEKAFIYDAIHH